LRRGFQAVFLAAAALAAVAHAEIIDRIAVSVGNSVITASDLDREVRVTALLNSMPPDFTPASKRATAERLIEQKLIRREIELSRYPTPDAATVEPVLEESRKTHFKSDDDFRRALAEYGITEQDVKDQLLWQLTLLRFIEVRFRPGIQATDQDIRDYFE
jgi:parvulin-like peptidyl-prolyl isomerase